MRPELTEAAFRRWEQVIATAVSLWPSPLIWQPGPTLPKPLTCAARIRDAVLSFHRYKWSPTLINTSKWQTIRDEITVSYTDNGEVRIGPRNDKANSFPVRPVLTTIDIVIPTTLNPDQRLDILRCLCVLRGMETLPTIVLDSLSDTDLEQLKLMAAQYDVAIVNNTDGHGQITLL